MTMWITVAMIVWAMFACFNFWALWTHDAKRWGRITRGDIGFYLFIAIVGPLGIGASLSALAGGRANGWFSKEVWRRRG
jgi:hypothetical protein